MPRVSPFLAALRRAVEHPSGPPRGTHLLVACSGGPDSTALLVGLGELAAAHQLLLSAAYLDHGLRGAETRAEAEFVAQLARAHAMPFHHRVLTLEPSASLEDRARRARYRALGTLAREVGATRIVTAHTRDDHVETILLQLLRGTGRRGLAGIRGKSGALWRPLLEVTRADVRAFLGQRGLAFMVDRSNADLRFRRNRVRRLLVPLLEAEFNPQLGRALSGLAGRLRDEDDLLDGLAGGRWHALSAQGRLSVEVYAEPRALGRRIVQEWLRAASGRSPTAEHVERVLTLAGATHGSVSVRGGRVLCEPPWLDYRPGAPTVGEPFRMEIEPGGTAVHPEGHWTISLSPVGPWTPTGLAGASPSHAVFDADLLGSQLVVRSPVAGDRVHLAGVGTRKVHDVLIDARVPREARRHVPIVLGGDVILWVGGLVRGSAVQVTATTRRIVTATLVPGALPLT